jgi:hypothetical protein
LRLTASRCTFPRNCDRGLFRFRFPMKRLCLCDLFSESLLFEREEEKRLKEERAIPDCASSQSFLQDRRDAIRNDVVVRCCLSVETTKSVYMSMRQIASRSLLPKIVCSLRHGMPLGVPFQDRRSCVNFR